MTGLYAVITTIQPPTASVRLLADRLEEESAVLVVAGDAKGPAAYDLTGADGEPGCRGAVKLAFLSLQNQLSGPFDLARRLPTGHYSRKNLGYLHAIAAGATCIYETDDDNAPTPEWCLRTEWLESASVVRVSSKGDGAGDFWANVYSYFTKELIWPRGLPLDAIREPLPPLEGPLPGGRRVHAPIQQGLANNSPDVDAIWRLVLDRPFSFESGPSVYLPAGVWCPFNSQSTWWWPVAYPLLYIPSHCSFRMCDIWRGLVAQRCLWELGAGVAFHAAEVFQDRNDHDLVWDFRDEVPGYQGNRAFAHVLADLDLRPGVAEAAKNLRTCYLALVEAGFFPDEELGLVDSWTRSVSECLTRRDPAGRGECR